MRSRYSAYAAGAVDYLWATWHPRTRPAAPPRAGDGLGWVGLEILDVVAGRSGDERGEVEFRARYRPAGEPDGRVESLHERSRFVVRGGRWCYVDGDVLG